LTDRHEDHQPVALQSLAILAGVSALSAPPAAWLMGSGFGHKQDPSTPAMSDRPLSADASVRSTSVPVAPQVRSVAPQPQPTAAQNEFAADDDVVLRHTDDRAEQGGSADVGKFAATYRDLAERFAAESSTDTGTRVRSQFLEQLSPDAGAEPMALQLECRQRICRVQLAGPDLDKSRTMEEITHLGKFRQIVGMERPLSGGATISDVCLSMP
jgi:hypothetical protein